MRRLPAEVSLLLAVGAPLLLVVACSGDDPAVGSLEPAVVMEATWNVGVTESADSCDAVVPADFSSTAVVAAEGDSYHVSLTDESSGSCWLLPFSPAGRTLSWSGGMILASHPCNDGCRVRMEVTVSLTFAPGGRFSGVETIRYIPESPECDHPACRFPCEPAELEHPLAPPSRRPCAFACEATYRWTGALCERCTTTSAANACSSDDVLREMMQSHH